MKEFEIIDSLSDKEFIKKSKEWFYPRKIGSTYQCNDPQVKNCNYFYEGFGLGWYDNHSYIVCGGCLYVSLDTDNKTIGCCGRRYPRKFIFLTELWKL